MDKQRLNFSVPVVLHKAYQKKAEELGVSQTNLYIMALWQYLQQQQGITALTRLTEQDKDFDVKSILNEIKTIAMEKEI